MTPEQREREQELVDICFQLVLTVREHVRRFPKDSEKMAAWVAGQLRACGFDTKPCGASWGVLVHKKGTKK